MPRLDELKFGTDASSFFIDKNIRFYRGNSMRGTFHLGDRLVIVPTPLPFIAIGDIIVFRNSNYREGEETVHRVIAVSETGLITRGDNNMYRDLKPVQWEQIVGKVEMIVKKGGRKWQVVGGSKGMLKARTRWKLLLLEKWTRKVLSRPYHWLRNSGMVCRLWKPSITTLHLLTEQGSLIKYLYNNQSVAVWDPVMRRFDCRKPFDLVIHPPEELQ